MSAGWSKSRSAQPWRRGSEMIDWKATAKHFRREMRNGIAYHRRIATAERARRVILVNAMSELLPEIALSGPDRDFCLGCSQQLDPGTGHRDWCPYIVALNAVTEAGRSIG